MGRGTRSLATKTALRICYFSSMYSTMRLPAAVALLCVWAVIACVSVHQRLDAPKRSADLGLCDQLPPIVQHAGTRPSPLRSAATAESAYQTAFWGRVAFDAVPPFEINTHDPTLQDVYISGSVHRGERWDPFLWTLLTHVLTARQHPQLVVDVGANLGYFSLMAAALGHAVVAFEPMGRNAAKLQASIARNRGFVDKITLYQNAVASRADEIVSLTATHASNQGNGQMRYQPSFAGGVYGIDYAKTVRLDDVIDEDVLFIKIDVEGLEAEVLNGASNLLCRHIVRFIVIEFSEETRRSERCPAGRMLRRMEALGYAISDIVAGAPRLSADAADYPPNLLFTLLDTSRPAQCT